MATSRVCRPAGAMGVPQAALLRARGSSRSCHIAHCAHRNETTQQWVAHTEESESLFPVRHPGSFPATGAHAGRESDSATTSEVAPQATPFDPLRDGPLRYLGYANECGEALAAWLPPFGVPASYAVAVAYVLVDTYDKAAAARRDAEGLRSSEHALNASADSTKAVNIGNIVRLLTSERAIDTLLWQLMASVVVPGFTIHQVVYFTHLALTAFARLDEPDALPSAVGGAVAALASSSGQGTVEACGLLERSLPTAAGLAAIPFIVHPIDSAVHALLDRSLRPYMRGVICDGAGGRDAGLDMCQVAFTDSDESDADGSASATPANSHAPSRGGDSQASSAASAASASAAAGRQATTQPLGAAVSSFDYGNCVETEGCSVREEYRNHAGDARSSSLRRALVKAVLLTSPIAVALLAAQQL